MAIRKLASSSFAWCRRDTWADLLKRDIPRGRMPSWKLLVLCLTTLLSMRLGLNRYTRTTGGRGPILAIDALAYDFGVLGPNEAPRHQFAFTNRGRADLRIENLSPCCGAKVDLDGPVQIPPGQTRHLTVSLPRIASSGEDGRIITVNTNDPRRPEVMLKLRWNVLNYVTPVPAAIDWGEVRSRQSEPRLVNLIKVSRQFRVLEVGASSPALKPSIVPLPRDAAFRQLRIDLLTSRLEPGEFRGTVRIRTNETDWSWVTIPVRATVLASVRIIPSTLFLGWVRPRTPVVAQAALRLPTPLGGHYLVHPEPSDRYRISLRRGRSGEDYLVRISPRVTLPPGRLTDTISLHFGGRRISVPVVGYVDASPQ